MDAVHYYSVTREATAPVTPPKHFEPLGAHVISVSHTYGITARSGAKNVAC